MSIDVPAGFGQLLRRYRTCAGLTQEQLAERTGLTSTAISMLERGARHRPHAHTVRQLAEALGLATGERATLEAAARNRGNSSITAAATPIAGTPFIGRRHELGLLERHLAVVGGPPVLMLAGEPGIGKSRLLGEAAGLAHRGGWSTLSGGCRRWGDQEAYEPLLSALKSYARRQSAAGLRADLRGCAWIARLLPELVDGPLDPLPSWKPAPEQEQRLVGESVARFLANVAGPSGTVLILDDLQWAARDALALLALLVRTPTGTPLRIVGAYRDTEIGMQDPLSVLLADLAHAGLAAHRTLAPLSSEEGHDLLDVLLPGEEAAEGEGDRASRERLLQRAGGVPFVILSFAQNLDDRTSAVDVPWDVAQSVRRRIADLPETTRAMLGTAAAMGRTIALPVLAEVLALPEDDVLAAIDAACRARLLVDDAAGYRFSHDIIQEVVEADLGTARRRAVHRRVAAAIEAVHAGGLIAHCEALAYHYLEAEAWDRAPAYLLQAADKAAAAGATRDALAYYDRARAVSEQMGPAGYETAAEVAEKSGFVRLGIADFQAAVADFRRMGRIAGQLSDRHRETLALAYSGIALYFGHDFTAAEEVLRCALGTAADFADVRLLAGVALAELLTITGRHADAAPFLVMAAELAPHAEDPFSQGWWVDLEGFTCQWRGDFDAAIAVFARWGGVVNAAHDLSLRLWLQWEEALAQGGKGNYERALDSLDDLIALCDRAGEAFIRARALNSKGWIHGELQDFQRALELNSESLEATQAIETANPEIQSNARLNLGDMLMALGRPAEAEEHYLVVGRTVRKPRPQDHFMLWRYAQHFLHSYGECRVAAGDLTTARDNADECLALALGSGSKKNIIKAHRLRGQVLSASGRPAEAETEIVAALDIARQIGNPPQLWKTYLALGEVLRALGRQKEACRAGRDALEVAERVAAGLHDQALRATFLSSAEVSRIRKMAEVSE